MKLTDVDVNEIIKSLDSTGYKELYVEIDDSGLKLRRTDAGDWVKNITPLKHANVVNAIVANEISATETDDKTVDLGGMIAVKTPLIGAFYRAPSPGAEPFVKEGDEVTEDTVIGIVETMKLMNSICAGIKGRVHKIFREDGEFVEKDETLLTIDPT